MPRHAVRSVVLVLGVLRVSSLVEELLELGRVGHLDLDKPGVRHCVAVHELRLVHQLLVHLDNLTGNGSINVAGSLDGLDAAKGLLLLERVADLRGTLRSVRLFTHPPVYTLPARERPLHQVGDNQPPPQRPANAAPRHASTESLQHPACHCSARRGGAQ